MLVEWRVVGGRRVASRGSGAGTREVAIKWRESLETATQGTENEHLLRRPTEVIPITNRLRVDHQHL
jgi:hypothetical protein